MSNQPSDFSLSALNVYINTEISGLFFQEAITPQLEDTSYQINVRVSTNSVNQLFLFHTSNTLGNTIESDLTDLSSSDFKYAFNVNQWNPSIQTTREERKLVVENYLIDLFGGNRIDALRNIDVFSNEDELDRDISDIFHNRANALQRQALEPSSNNVHGSFLHNGSLVTALASVIDNAASTNPDAVSQKLLEIASILSRDNNNNVLVRQFADTNTSNFDYNLPSGWRTFQFIENDVISFNLTIGQPSSFYPPWSENQSALSNGGTNTSFRINLIVTDSPSGQVADFFTPTITSQQLDTVVQSVQVPNVVANVLGISSENFNVISISNEIIDQSNVLLKTTVTLDLCFNTLTENNIQSIINDIRDSYATQLNVNPLSINVTLQSGSVIVIIEQVRDLPSRIDLSGLSVITLNQTASYIEPGVIAYVHGRTHVDGVPYTVDIDLGGLSPNNLVPGSYTITYSISGQSHISATRQVVVIDDIPPTLQLIGDASVSINQGDTYYELGARIIDNGVDIGAATPSVTVDVYTAGSYTITYNGVDAAGNAATPITRTVVVIDNIAPTLQLTGDASVSINQGETYTEQGARIIDNGVDIGAATPSGTVDVDTVGSYTITYNGVDAAGNAATPITRTINVLTLITSTSLYSQIGQDIYGKINDEKIGESVSINDDGTIIAIGAIRIDSNGPDAGQVKVYQYNGSQWIQLGQDINGEAANDLAGISVSLNGNGTIVAIGARRNDGNGQDSGHVRIYQYNGSQWIQMGQDIDGEAAADDSGYSVSLSSDGTIVAIGAIWNDGNGTESGHVRIYQYNGSQWIQLGADIDGEAAYNYSGHSVSLSSDGTIVAIGAPNNNGDLLIGGAAGHVRVYSYNGSQWIQLGQDINGEADLDLAGKSVSLNSDGTILAIGVQHHDGNGLDTGKVKVYQYNGSQWIQLGQDIDGEASEDNFGCSVSLNNSGTIIAIGAFGNDGNGPSSGHVRLYYYNGSQWDQIGSDIDGDAQYINFGYSVSLSGNGTTVVIGTPYGNNPENNIWGCGLVRVYKLAESFESPVFDYNSWTNISGREDEITISSGTYKVNGSSDVVSPVYGTIDGVLGSGVQVNGFSNGIYAGSDTLSGTGITAGWISYEFPYAIKCETITIYLLTYEPYTSRNIKRGKIFASNDGISWTQVFDINLSGADLNNLWDSSDPRWDGITTTNVSPVTLNLNLSTPYNRFAILFEEIMNFTGNYTLSLLMEVRFNGVKM